LFPIIKKQIKDGLMSAHTASLQAGQESYECIGKECYDKCSPWAKKLIDRKIEGVAVSIFQQIAHFFLNLFSPQYQTAYNWKLKKIENDVASVLSGDDAQDLSVLENIPELENISEIPSIRERTRSFSDLKTACVASFLTQSDQDQIRAMMVLILMNILSPTEDKSLPCDSVYMHTIAVLQEAKEQFMQVYMPKKLQEVFASQEGHKILPFLLRIYTKLPQEIQNVLEENISIILEEDNHPILAHLLDHYKTLPEAMQKTLQGHVRGKIQEGTEDPFTTHWKTQEKPAFTIDVTVNQATNFSLESAHIGILTIKGKLQEEDWRNILSSNTVHTIRWEKGNELDCILTQNDAKNLTLLTQKGLTTLELSDYELSEEFARTIVQSESIRTLKLKAKNLTLLTQKGLTTLELSDYELSEEFARTIVQSKSINALKLRECTGEIQRLLKRAIHQKECYERVELIETEIHPYPGADSVKTLIVDTKEILPSARKENVFGERSVSSSADQEKKQGRRASVSAKTSPDSRLVETKDTETVAPLPIDTHQATSDAKEEALNPSAEEESKGELPKDHSPIEADAPLREEDTVPQAEGKETVENAIETSQKEETASNHPELNAEVGTSEEGEEGSDAGSEEDVTRINSDLSLLFKDDN
jgi:hypothetical protein